MPQAPSARSLPDYAPIPRSSLGPAPNQKGHYVGRVDRNLCWDEISNTAAAPVIETYRTPLAATDVYTANTAFWVMESLRLDFGFGSRIHQ
jgi:hypothetical protein